MGVFYEYRCDECGETEVIRRPVELRDQVSDCELCGGLLRRDVAMPGYKIEGLAVDRFKMQDKVAENRQRAHESGWI